MKRKSLLTIFPFSGIFKLAYTYHQQLLYKNLKGLIMTFSMIFCFNVCFCQIKQSVDTIYYQIDTTGTPVNDRLITARIDGVHKWYKIHCSCLNNNIMPKFRTRMDNKTQVLKEKVDKLNFINLIDFLAFLKRNDTDDFEKKYRIYFVEKEGDNFYQNRAFFSGSKIYTID